MPIDDCGGISRKISAFLDGELDEKDKEAVRAHLEACASCSETLRRFKAADAGLRALPPVEPSPFFAARVAAAARALNEYHGPFRRFVLYPIPAAAALTAFIIFNIFTFAFNINALENGPRRELARKVVTQLARPASLINPVAVARLCGDCSRYMCQCMHEAGKKNICPCKDCEIDKAAGGNINTEGEHNVH
ncbi:MAG: hypothetical protein CVU79_05365 [Elusimicrobia bacterium HGW-Elusimicrobia-3]|jgi:anti-sigma factor RsiW|nr:MAG: hypothetical protein CVU79_05365 [Elusimicrobia bacterium HGW-Elusimicrobia-3]